MQKLKLTYQKTGPAKYLSHLDWMQVLERALRRTSLPIKYSEGYNPRMRIEYGPPLPIGVDGTEEVLIIEIDGWANPNRVREELAGNFPEGIEIAKIEIANPKAASLDSSAQASDYLFELKPEDAEKIKSGLATLLQQTEISIDKKSKAGIQKTNVRPMIFALELIEAEKAGSSNTRQLRASLQTSNHGTLRPRELCEILKIEPVKIVRNKILFR
ncbi:MAG: TIGR03936 family radical SAM-associated protein [Candidatus Margulisiibacteriota bacterium]